MRVELLLSRNLSNLAKAQVIWIRLVERKYNIHKIFTQLCDIGNTGFGRDRDHGFCWMYGYLSKSLIRLHKMPKEGNCMCGFIGEKVGEILVTTGMNLVRIFKLLS